MLNLVTRYAAVLAVLIVGDALWLSYFAKAMFRPTLGGILLDDPRWLAAGAFYVLFAFGVMYFAVMPALRQGGWTNAALTGALLGFVAYMTYDMTNLASIKAWTLSLALVDMAWGTLITAVAASTGYWVRLS
jgi:uncharacterized membrane protein